MRPFIHLNADWIRMQSKSLFWQLFFLCLMYSPFLSSQQAKARIFNQEEVVTEILDLANGPASDLRLTGGFPQRVPNGGCSTIWLDGGAIKLVFFNPTSTFPLTIQTLSNGPASDLQFKGSYPEDTSGLFGVTAAWLEGGAEAEIPYIKEFTDTVK